MAITLLAVRKSASGGEAQGDIVVAATVVTERDATDPHVARAGGRVVAAGRVVQKGCRANSGVLGSIPPYLISDVEKECSRTHGGVVAAVSVAPE